MGIDLAYAYANARLKAMHSKLLDRDAMRELIDAKTLPEFIELLEESPYKPSFVAASTTHAGHELVKKALDDDLAVSMRKLRRIIPAKATALLDGFLKGWEANNIKKVIALKALSREVNAGDFMHYGDGEALIAKLSSQKDLDGVVKALAASPWGPAIDRAAVKWRSSGDYRVLLDALDEHYHELLGAAARGERDPDVRGFMLQRVSIINAMTALRLRKSGVAAADSMQYMINAPEQEFTAKMMAAKGLKEAVAIAATRLKIDVPQDIVQQASDSGELSAIEEAFNTAFLRTARKALSRSVLSPGVLVGYLHLKQEEVHSLRMIAYATQFEVKGDIRDSILARL